MNEKEGVSKSSSKINGNIKLDFSCNCQSHLRFIMMLMSQKNVSETEGREENPTVGNLIWQGKLVSYEPNKAVWREAELQLSRQSLLLLRLIFFRWLVKESWRRQMIGTLEEINVWRTTLVTPKVVMIPLLDISIVLLIMVFEEENQARALQVIPVDLSPLLKVLWPSGDFKCFINARK